MDSSTVWDMCQVYVVVNPCDMIFHSSRIAIPQILSQPSVDGHSHACVAQLDAYMYTCARASSSSMFVPTLSTCISSLECFPFASNVLLHISINYCAV